MDIKTQIIIAEKEMLNILGLNNNIRNKTICSPFRADKVPSFSIFRGRDSKLRYYDFGSGEHGDSIDFIKKMGKQLNTKEITWDEKLERPIEKEATTLITLKPRNFVNKDIEFWTSYGATVEMLVSLVNDGILTAVSECYFSKPGVSFKKKCDELAYAMTNKDYRSYKPNEQIPFKLYQPYNKKNKWISKMSGKEWFFWDRIPNRGSHIIITSSFKDALCIWSQLDIPAVAPQGEGFLLPEEKMSYLRERYDNIWLVFDNDEAGKRFAKRNCQKYPYLYNIELPNIHGAKDPSDLYRELGSAFEEFMYYIV